MEVRSGEMLAVAAEGGRGAVGGGDGEALAAFIGHWQC